MTSNKSPSAEQFISKVCQYGTKNQYVSKSAGKSISKRVRTFVYDELPKRKLASTYNTRPLKNCDNLVLHFDLDRTSAFQYDNRLWVMSRTPDWTRGLRKSFPDDSMYYYISCFFHFAQQYTSRACFVQVIGSIALTYQIPTHFYSDISQSYFTRNGILSDTEIRSKYSLDKKHKMDSSRQKMFLRLCDQINGLDPYVHRALFNYVRGLELRQSGFDEEAICAFDKVVDVVCQFFTNLKKPATAFSREDLKIILELSEQEATIATRLYKLRNYFGAHPAQSKWWDFSEIFDEDELDEFQKFTARLIIKFVHFESQNRTIDKNPNDWSNWFVMNWNVLWNSIWFEKLDKAL
ncbi:hypothetical protein [Fretibacter rubidus]|uniref:hypothetical protein n=1 Tax=Fretibacter rubidus TaxID=570162 RepID=UPI00352A67C5